MLVHILDQAFGRRAWHGTNLRGSLRGLTARQAEWRPAGGRHNIWELAVHSAYWKYCVRRRLLGEKRGGFAVKGSNFWELPPKGRVATERDWREAVKLLDVEHGKLRLAVEGFPAARLFRRVERSRWNYFETIVGAASHDLYHAGQIQLLKRLMSSRRSALK